MTILTIILILIGVLLIWLIARCIMGRQFLKDAQKDSLIIFGKKGKGKTLLFSEMTRNCKKGYLSTTDFKHRKQEIINYDAVNVDPNTWEDVLNGEVKPINLKDWEKKPVFLDDAGVYIPNFADSMLKREYASMPIAYAIWRHLYNAPIHINSQSVERAWKMVREQADGFIQVRGVRWFLGLGFIRCTYYDRVESAKAELAPMKKGIFNKYQSAELEKYRAEHGLIKDFLIFAPSWRNRYDDRYFKRVFTGAEKKPPMETSTSSVK